MTNQELALMLYWKFLYLNQILCNGLLITLMFVLLSIVIKYFITCYMYLIKNPQPQCCTYLKMWMISLLKIHINCSSWFWLKIKWLFIINEMRVQMSKNNHYRKFSLLHYVNDCFSYMLKVWGKILIIAFSIFSYQNKNWFLFNLRKLESDD